MFGLPLHPLVVHLVVVALPAGALGLIAAVVWPRARHRYGVLTLIVLTIGALAGVAARLTGVQLAEEKTLPERHATFGTALMIVALVATALGWLWWWLERRRDAAPPGTSPLAAMAAGALVVTAAVAVVGLTVATGHTGAEAVWSKQGPPPRPTPAPKEDGPGIMPYFTLAEVAKHGTQDSCWAAVDNGVYDLTEWIGSHPGGPQRILNLCGTDASAAFRIQHGVKPRPNVQLDRLLIGYLRG